MSSPDDAGSPGLYRGLRRIEVVSLTLNNVIGAGIFAMPAALAASAGRSSLVVLLVAFLLVSLIALCTVEVASLYRVTGGPMYYASTAFGMRAGFIVGWLMYLSRLAAFGAIASTMLAYAAGVWPPLGSALGRAAGITMFVAAIAAFNLRGVVHGARVSSLLMLAKGVPLVLLALVGLWLGGWRTLPPPVPHGLPDLTSALLLAFFACMGFEQVAVVAGEARDPQRDLPVGILSAVAIIGTLYMLLMFACFATVPDLAHSARPLADAAKSLLGPIGATAMSLTAVFSCAGALSVSMLVTPRVLYALADQGDLPPLLARVESVRLTPAAAIITTAILVWLLTVSGTFIYLATFSVIARMLMYASTCVALITLRQRDGPAPVTIPLGTVWAVIAVLCSAAVLVKTPGVAVRDVSIAVLFGWVARLLVRRHPPKQGMLDTA